jgi:osmotically-inducible protein OsmY
MRSDMDVKRDVEAELRAHPDIDATDIAAAVKNGVVTLSGYVRSFSQKWEAERAAKRVAGVAGVANDIEVRLPIFNQRPDPEIARDAVAAIQSQLPYAADHIRIIVRDGWIALEGTTEWNYQCERAEEAVRRLRGVKGVTNLITLQPRVPPIEIKQKIEEAFRRSAEIDAARITVTTDGGTVTLSGTVRSWAERQEAERSAWSVPGVVKVDNQIVVSPP